MHVLVQITRANNSDDSSFRDDVHWVLTSPVETLAENHSIEGSVENHPNSHQIFLALYLRTEKGET